MTDGTGLWIFLLSDRPSERHLNVSESMKRGIISGGLQTKQWTTKMRMVYHHVYKVVVVSIRNTEWMKMQMKQIKRMHFTPARVAIINGTNQPDKQNGKKAE